MGIAVLSTSRGIVTSRTAEREGIGGEVICFVW
jgi:small subunit ribosomal protein S8